MIGIVPQARSIVTNHFIKGTLPRTENHNIKVKRETFSIGRKEGLIKEWNSFVLWMMEIDNKEELGGSGERSGSVATNIWFPSRCKSIY